MSVERLTKERDLAREQRDQVMRMVELRMNKIEALKLELALVDADLPADFHLDLAPAERVAKYVERCQQAEAERDDLNSLFELQHTRSKEADEMWRAAHPEKGFIIPDLGDLLAWLMAEITRLKPLAVKYGLEWEIARKDNNMLRGIIAKSEMACIYCGLVKAEMGKCKSGFPGCARADDLAGGNA